MRPAEGFEQSGGGVGRAGIPEHDQIKGGDRRREETGRGADAERPTWTERVGHPPHDRRADRRPAEREREQDGNDAAAHLRLGRRLDQTVGRGGQGLRGDADDEFWAVRCIHEPTLDTSAPAAQIR